MLLCQFVNKADNTFSMFFDEAVVVDRSLLVDM